MNGIFDKEWKGTKEECSQNGNYTPHHVAQSEEAPAIVCTTIQGSGPDFLSSPTKSSMPLGFANRYQTCLRFIHSYLFLTKLWKRKAVVLTLSVF